MPTCDKCGKGSSYLQRQNETGVKGIFWCKTCLGEPEEPIKGEDMSVERQLEFWVRGKSIHNSRRDECCPDFSCCQPKLAWPKEKRIKFAVACVNEDSMLMDALVGLTGDDVYVAGQETQDE